MVESPEEYPAFLQIVDVVFDILSHHLQTITIDHWNIINHLVFLNLKVIAKLFHTLLILIQPRIQTKQFVILFIIFLHKQGIHQHHPNTLSQISQVHQSIHQSTNTNEVFGVLNSFNYAVGQDPKLSIHAFILSQDIADMIHLSQKYYLFIEI